MDASNVLAALFRTTGVGAVTAEFEAGLGVPALYIHEISVPKKQAREKTNREAEADDVASLNVLGMIFNLALGSGVAFCLFIFFSRAAAISARLTAS